MKRLLFFSFILVFSSFVLAQTEIFSDDFEDGNLEDWTSSGTGDWTASDSLPISGSYSLRHSLSDSTGNSYIFRDLSSLDVSERTTIWRFSIKNGDWDPSDSDKFWVYILLDGIDGDGYAVGVNKGEASDTLRFLRIADGLLDTVLICSAFQWESDDTVGIEIKRDLFGNWKLGYDSTGGFDNLKYSSSTFDATYSTSVFFVLSFYFTPASVGALWMDDVSVTQATSSRLAAKAFLEGPFETDSMKTLLKANNYLPLSQPFSSSPWNYEGDETVASIPDSVVDWMLIELRSGTAASSVVSRRAGFILRNGDIVDTSGGGPLYFADVDTGAYYIVLTHRNHLPIMSANTVHMGLDTSYYDFSGGSGQAYGSNAQKILGQDAQSNDIYGMYTGDASANGQVQNDDNNDYWRPQNGLAGYRSADFSLNGQVQNDDSNDYWKKNVGFGTQVPQ